MHNHDCFRDLGYVSSNNSDAGIRLEVVLKRRLMSAILTVYLPTILILPIHFGLFQHYVKPGTAHDQCTLF